MKRPIYSIIAPAALAMALLLSGCGTEETPAGATAGQEGDFYLLVDLPGASRCDTRVVYDYDALFYEEDEGNITARWEIGDVIKVYESKRDEGTFTDVYADYDAYNEKFPFPYAPVDDVYYRFECVGFSDGLATEEGEEPKGTAHGIFRYIGLAKTHVWGGTDGIYTVDLDVIYNHKINNWNRFEGLVIYGNPLRNYMMRHQTEDRSMDHLKYGQRMKGHICAKNFADWFSNQELKEDYGDSGGAEGLILYNTSNCVFRIIMSGFHYDVYGGASVELYLPGITDGHAEDDVRNSPMTLTLGDPDDYYERQDPWALAYERGADPKSERYSITAYVVGWPGTLKGGDKAKVVLKDPIYGATYTWELSREDDIEFKESNYYTIDLTRDYIPDVVIDTPVTPPFDDDNKPFDPDASQNGSSNPDNEESDE